MSAQHHERSQRVKAVLVLQDGRFFKGTAFGAPVNSFGEVNFSTSMTGYQEALTDPASNGTLMTLTFPHIGNTGMNTEDRQSSKIQANGLIILELARRASNWRSESTLEEDLLEAGVPGIQGVDTRALTRHIRENGVQKAGIFVGDAAEKPMEQLVAEVSNTSVAPQYVTDAETVSITPSDYGLTVEPSVKIAAIDYGIKKADLISLVSRGAEVTLLPADATAEDIKATGAAGVFLSDGATDPRTMTTQVAVVKELLEAGLPMLGVSLGQMILGLAAGATVYTLKVGHHGANLSVQETATQRVLITAESRHYAVDVTDTSGIEVTHTAINDGVVEGIKISGKNAIAVGFHPEGGSGPLDASNIFDQFVTSLKAE